jgi:outer membrane receptor protein involved in Fe transport
VSHFKERALFGDLVYKINDRLDVGGGTRYAQNTETDCTPMSTGFGSTPVPCSSRPYSGVTTWMANTRFHIDPRSMLYLRWATGYRPGGCNNGCVTSSALEIPGTFSPDKVANYEVGYKAQLFDQRMQIDVALFYIDWRDIQAQVINSIGLGYTGNGSTASSRGVEWTSGFRITDHLSVQATLDYTDSHLTADAPGIGGKNGDQLPESPRWSGSVTAEFRQPVGSNAQYVLGGGYRYRDTVVNQFEGTGEPLPIGPQNLVDLYTGLNINQMSARLYARNLLNNRSYMGLLYLTQPQLPMFVPVQPRTVGISLDYHF